MELYRREIEENNETKIDNYLLRLSVYLFNNKSKKQSNLRRSNSYSTATNTDFTNINNECKYIISKLNFYNIVFFVLFYIIIVIYYII